MSRHAFVNMLRGPVTACANKNVPSKRGESDKRERALRPGVYTNNPGSMNAIAIFRQLRAWGTGGLSAYSGTIGSDEIA
jgi:hypothetical protein